MVVTGLNGCGDNYDTPTGYDAVCLSGIREGYIFVQQHLVSYKWSRKSAIYMVAEGKRRMKGKS